jgi:hypothetical protein
LLENLLTSPSIFETVIVPRVLLAGINLAKETTSGKFAFSAGPMGG